MKYEIRNDTIFTPGIYFGQPRWAPYFWDQVRQGLADARERGGYIFDLTKKDRDKYPELERYDIVYLSKDRKGYISAEAQYE